MPQPWSPLNLILAATSAFLYHFLSPFYAKRVLSRDGYDTPHEEHTTQEPQSKRTSEALPLEGGHLMSAYIISV